MRAGTLVGEIAKACSGGGPRSCATGVVRETILDHLTTGRAEARTLPVGSAGRAGPCAGGFCVDVARLFGRE
jgi:hypothetical protein